MFWCLLNLHWEELVRLFLSDLTSNFPWSVSLYNSSIWRPTNQCLMKYFFIGKVHFHKSMALSTNTRILDFWCEFIFILSTPIVSWNFYKVMFFFRFWREFSKREDFPRKNPFQWFFFPISKPVFTPFFHSTVVFLKRDVVINYLCQL